MLAGLVASAVTWWLYLYFHPSPDANHTTGSVLGPVEGFVTLILFLVSGLLLGYSWEIWKWFWKWLWRNRESIALVAGFAYVAVDAESLAFARVAGCVAIYILWQILRVLQRIDEKLGSNQIMDDLRASMLARQRKK